MVWKGYTWKTFVLELKHPNSEKKYAHNNQQDHSNVEVETKMRVLNALQIL